MTYAQKIEQKRQRLLERAAKKREESNDAYNRGLEIGSRMVFGQPILVGHHSESRHRRDIERMHSLADKTCRLDNYADVLEMRASKIGTGGISSDDELALDKLQDKLKRLQEDHERMKLANKQLREGGIEAVTVATDDELEYFKRFPKSKIFEQFSLANNLQRIKHTKDRIAKLEKMAKIETVSNNYKCDQYEIKIEDNRVQFIFNGKPTPEIIAILKRAAFKWSPTRTAWVRQLTPNAIHAMNQLKTFLKAH